MQQIQNPVIVKACFKKRRKLTSKTLKQNLVVTFQAGLIESKTRKLS